MFLAGDQDIAVKNVMTPLERTFMLSVDEKLSFETIAKIFRVRLTVVCLNVFGARDKLIFFFARHRPDILVFPSMKFHRYAASLQCV